MTTSGTCSMYPNVNVPIARGAGTHYLIKLWQERLRTTWWTAREGLFLDFCQFCSTDYHIRPELPWCVTQEVGFNELNDVIAKFPQPTSCSSQQLYRDTLHGTLSVRLRRTSPQKPSSESSCPSYGSPFVCYEHLRYAGFQFPARHFSSWTTEKQLETFWNWCILPSGCSAYKYTSQDRETRETRVTWLISF